jgi:hypothetical protein
MKKSTTKLKVSVTYAHCTIISTFPMKCPLCGTMTLPNGLHTCTKQEPK